jgi:RNase P subunit RPR2
LHGIEVIPMAVSDDGLDQTWRQLAEEALTGMSQWRWEHPKATLSEIEAALDERLRRRRAQVLQDTALASSAAHFQQMAAQERPVCPKCQTPLVTRGPSTRRLQTEGGGELALSREYGTCPRCGEGLFPPG